jgi:hypothetical protein
MHVKEIYAIFIHLFDSGILLSIDLNKKKGEKGGGINSFFNTVSVSRYSHPITVTRDPL